jgi:hypothetical protein
MSYSETFTFEEGLGLLVDELEAGAAAPEHNLSELPINQIRMRHSVFQPREFDDPAESESHVQALMGAIKAEPLNRLDPVVVWWSGKHWTVLDGHHRLLAYERVRKGGFKQYQADGNQSQRWLVPIKRFKGTLQEALIEATRANSKDKLPMTKDDKMNRAWILTVACKDLSKQAVANSCKVASRTFARMRTKLKEIQEGKPEDWRSEALAMSWREAQRYGERPEKDYDDSWQEKLAIDWKKRLGKTFGKKLAEQPDITARAIELYSEQLSEQLGRYLYNPDDELEEADF